MQNNHYSHQVHRFRLTRSLGNVRWISKCNFKRSTCKSCVSKVAKFFSTKLSIVMSASIPEVLKRCEKYKKVKNYKQIRNYEMCGMLKWGTSNGSKTGIFNSGNPVVIKPLNCSKTTLTKLSSKLSFRGTPNPVNNKARKIIQPLPIVIFHRCFISSKGLITL